jgi:hypothetical protein
MMMMVLPFPFVGCRFEKKRDGEVVTTGSGIDMGDPRIIWEWG